MILRLGLSLGYFVWKLSLEVLRFDTFALAMSVVDLSFGDFRPGSSP